MLNVASEKTLTERPTGLFIRENAAEQRAAKGRVRDGNTVTAAPNRTRLCGRQGRSQVERSRDLTETAEMVLDNEDAVKTERLSLNVVMTGTPSLLSNSGLPRRAQRYRRGKFYATPFIEPPWSASALDGRCQPSHART